MRMRRGYIERKDRLVSRTVYSHLLMEVQSDSDEIGDCDRYVCKIGIHSGFYKPLARFA